jgi:hypothetical protein
MEASKDDTQPIEPQTHNRPVVTQKSLPLSETGSENGK